MSHQHISSRSKGFTLVELLVVIGIIAVLISILMPAFVKAREASNRAACMSNMRQIVLGTLMYVNDNKGNLPFANWRGQEQNAGSVPFQTGWLYTWPNNLAQQVLLTMNPDGVKTGHVYKYSKNINVFHCPMDQPPYPNGSTRHMSSYLMNGEVCSNGSVPSYKITKFRPGAVILMETNELSGAWNDGANYAGEGIPERHSRAGSVATIEGTVHWIPRTIILKADMSQNKPNRFFCNPANNNQNGGWKMVD